MDILKRVENMFQGKYDINDADYFKVPEQERDNMAKLVINKFFWQLKMDNTWKVYYLQYLEQRILELIIEDKYEEADLYKRIKKLINLY
jgi:hypothetical protein